MLTFSAIIIVPTHQRAAAAHSQSAILLKTLPPPNKQRAAPAASHYFQHLHSIESTIHNTQNCYKIAPQRNLRKIYYEKIIAAFELGFVCVDLWKLEINGAVQIQALSAAACSQQSVISQTPQVSVPLKNNLSSTMRCLRWRRPLYYRLDNPIYVINVKHSKRLNNKSAGRVWIAWRDTQCGGNWIETP